MVRARADFRFIALAAVLIFNTACGVKQYNSRTRRGGEERPALFAAFGPFYSGTNDGNNLTTNPATCGSVNRPCMKMRASVGLPYQFDTNKNSQQGPLVAGTSFPAAPNAYGTQIAGPGKVKSAAVDGAQLENKDLKMMQRQTAGGEVSFP